MSRKIFVNLPVKDLQRSVAFFTALPGYAWDRRGVASGNPFTVRALAYLAAGHVTHHARILRERYLNV